MLAAVASRSFAHGKDGFSAKIAGARDSGRRSQPHEFGRHSPGVRLLG